MTFPVAVLPLCPVSCGSLLVRIGGELQAVIVVKATFSLAHERSAWPIEPDAIVIEDDHVGGHPATPLVAASDLVPRLPGAGVVVMGTAHAPQDRPTTEMAVRVAIFQGGSAVLNKYLVVHGDRSREDAPPTPFLRMPITYERAYGGPAVGENPAGVGASSGGTQPNLVDPRAPTHPAGFGPISRTWEPRARAMRAFDAAPREGAAVVLAADTDFAIFHAAPVDQRIDEPLASDAWIVLDGVTSTQRVQTQLPFARAEARYARIDRPGALAAVELVADTLSVDADRLVASVVWRGRIPLSSEAEAAKLRVYAGLELPTLPIRWPGPHPAAHPPPDKIEKEESWPDLPDTTSERDVHTIRAALLAEAEARAKGHGTRIA